MKEFDERRREGTREQNAGKLVMGSGIVGIRRSAFANGW